VFLFTGEQGKQSADSGCQQATKEAIVTYTLTHFISKPKISSENNKQLIKF
jgi:hypothetical protein